MDSAFTLDEYREQGLVRKVVDALLSVCGKERIIYIHSTLPLRQFQGWLKQQPTNAQES